MLKVQLNKAQFTAALKRVLPAVERKTSIPILANVLITADTEGIQITGTDLDVRLTVPVTAKVMKLGQVAVPAHKLADTLAKLRTMDADTVELAEGENHWVTLKCAALTVKLPGMGTENFPVAEKFPVGGASTITVQASVLAGLIHRTRYAIAKQESRYTLNGVLLVWERDAVKMVATDGHRCAVAKYPNAGEPFRALVPRATIDILYTLANAGSKGSVTVAHNASHVFASGDGWDLTGRLLTGQFPNYEQIMPSGDRMKRVQVHGKTLAATVARIASFADEWSQATRWELVVNKGIQVSAQSTETGQASELVPCACEDTCVIGFDADYVLDILGTMGKEQEIRLLLRDSQSPGLWMPVEENGWDTRVVVMPMRL